VLGPGTSRCVRLHAGLGVRARRGTHIELRHAGTAGAMARSGLDGVIPSEVEGSRSASIRHEIPRQARDDSTPESLRDRATA